MTWTADGITAGIDRIASYTNLAAGKYKLTVQAFELADPDAFTESVLLLEKRPYFYETWWFAAALLAAVSLLIWLIYRSRVRTLSLRFKAVLEERTRIARAMHDTIIQGCTSISALLEAISSLSGNSSPLEQELIEHARTQVRTTVQEAREAVWDLRHNDDLVPDLDHSITVMAESVGRDTGTAVQCKNRRSRLPNFGSTGERNHDGGARGCLQRGTAQSSATYCRRRCLFARRPEGCHQR